ncbi:hypothetical protein PL373_00715 [Tenacibaculum maritimum]|nr:hypothetical protein [Tenacibaculum maritimum]MDB0599693.1 hypothetical protein [Tenacibaculum maritimum]MDB0613647.1 hypothetical protein [Tenacibaculum maritimum]
MPPKNKTNIALNINSLISELKIEVTQSDNNKSLSVSQKDLLELESQVVELLLKCVSDVVPKKLKDALAEEKEGDYNPTKAKPIERYFKERFIAICPENLSGNRPSRYSPFLTSEQSLPSLTLEEIEKHFFEAKGKLINQPLKPCKENQPVNEATHSLPLHQSIHSKLDEIISLLKI